MIECPLCNHTTTRTVDEIHDVLFVECSTCSTFFKHPDYWVSPKQEKDRYLAHKNDVNNIGYQKFVSPIVQAVKEHYCQNSIGLDFGAGTGPVITKLLQDDGYMLNLYDPFFHPNKSALRKHYDYIVCCEVIEHFYNPNKEFKLLQNLLKPKGRLFCMTSLMPERRNFKNWWYIKDSTHVIFYSEKSLRWIQKSCEFSEVLIEDKLITFIK